MRNTKHSIGILASLIGLLAMASGCSHQQATYTAAPSQQAENKFLSDMENLPMEKRADYVQSHMDVLDMFKMDPDKSKMAKLNSLMPRRIP